MYGLNRLKSAYHLAALFAASPAAAAYQKRLFRFSSLFRSTPSKHSSSAAIDEFVFVGKGEKISVQSLIENLNRSRKNDWKKTYKRKVLPPELSRNTAMLTCESAADGGVCDVYLVGTNHYSEKSAQQVKAVIEFLKPQVVFLELCPSRSHGIGPFKISEYGGVKIPSGKEFHVAYEEAMKYGAKVILGDRPEEITSLRFWYKNPLWYKIERRLLSRFEEELSCQDPTKLVNETEDNERTVDQWASEYELPPGYIETMVNERDQYMSAKLLRVAREHNSVVAVVGRLHLPGIQKNWKQPVDVEQLLSAPSDRMLIISYRVYQGLYACSLFAFFILL